MVYFYKKDMPMTADNLHWSPCSLAMGRFLMGAAGIWLEEGCGRAEGSGIDALRACVSTLCRYDSLLGDMTCQ
jgi:hypothetical protein